VTQGGQRVSAVSVLLALFCVPSVTVAVIISLVGIIVVASKCRLRMQHTRRRNFSMDEVSPEIGDDGHDRLSENVNPIRVQTTGQDSGAVRLVVIAFLVIAVTLVVVDSLGGQHIESAILNFLEWVEEHPHEGVLAVICVYIIATILFVPGSVLTFGTGYAFGSAYDNKLEGVLVASLVSV
jgi:hypothetical protein